MGPKHLFSLYLCFNQLESIIYPYRTLRFVSYFFQPARQFHFRSLTKEQLMNTVEKAEFTPPRSASKRRRWTWLAVLAITAVIVAGVVHGIRKSEADKTAAIEPPAIPTVKTATSHLGSIGYYVEALGTVTPVATVNLYSQINGHGDGSPLRRRPDGPSRRPADRYRPSPLRSARKLKASPGNLAARSRSADASRNGSRPL